MAEEAMDEDYLISTTMCRTRTLQAFYTRVTHAMSFKRGRDNATVV